MFSATTKEAAVATKELAENDVKNNVQTMKRNARALADKAGNDLSDYAHDAGRAARAYIDRAGEQLGSARDTVRNEIESNPVRSSIIALGLGYALASLLRR